MIKCQIGLNLLLSEEDIYILVNHYNSLLINKCILDCIKMYHPFYATRLIAKSSVKSIRIINHKSKFK